MIMLDCDFDINTTGYLKALLARKDPQILIGRYISRYTSSWKVTNKAECAAIAAANEQQKAIGGYCMMWLIYEDNGKPRGEAQGTADASVTRQWISDLDMPAGGLICYTSDEDGPISPVLAATRAYFNGLKDKDGKSICTRGLYASGALNKAAKDAGLIDVRWPTMSLGFSGTRDAIRRGEYEIDQLVDVHFAGRDIDPDVIRQGIDPMSLGFFVPGQPLPAPLVA